MASSAPVQSAPLLQPYTDDPDVERDDPVQTTTDGDLNNRQNNVLPPSPNLLLAAILHLLVVLDAPVVLALGFIFSERYRQIPSRNYIGWAAHIYFELFGVSVMTIIAAIWSFANLVSLRSRRPSSLLGPAFLGALVHAFLAFYLASTSLEQLRHMIFRGNLESDCHYWDHDLQKGVYGPPECYAWVAKNTTLGWIYVAFLLVMSITQIILLSAYLVWTWKTFVAWQLRRPTGTSRGGGVGRWVSSLSFPTGQMTVSFSVQFLGPRSFPAVTGNVTREGVQQPSGQQLPEQATQVGSGSG